MKKAIPFYVVNCEKDNMYVYDVHLVNSEVISVRTNLDYFEFLKALFERDCFVQLVGCQFKVAICKDQIMYVSNRNFEDEIKTKGIELVKYLAIRKLTPKECFRLQG